MNVLNNVILNVYHTRVTLVYHQWQYMFEWANIIHKNLCFSEWVMCRWTYSFSWTFRGRRAYRCCCWIWSLKFIADVLPIRINAPIIIQHLFHAKTKLRSLDVVVKELWSVSFCWTNMLGRRDWCRERSFDLTTWDVYWDWSSNGFMRNDAYFGDWNKLVWELG